MGFSEHSSQGSFNSSTPITLVSAPASGFKRIVPNISAINTNDADVTITVSRDVNGSPIELFVLTLNPGDKYVHDLTVVLEDTDETIIGTVTGTISTQPAYIATYGDEEE